ncbi:MAG: hypothetical protein GXO74_06370 [Calditrichaeota bacterium]|nr:hypothetical protein [Calditrichota bacterium]
MSAIHSYMALRKFTEILNICEKFPDDALPDILYGKVYAYFRPDRLAKGKKRSKKPWTTGIESAFLGQTRG